MERLLTLSDKYLDDRGARGLECGREITRYARKTRVVVTAAVAADMVDDAAYQGWFTDAAPAGVVRAARNAFRYLVAKGLPYSKGTRLADNGLVMPGDA